MQCCARASNTVTPACSHIDAPCCSICWRSCSSRSFSSCFALAASLNALLSAAASAATATTTFSPVFAGMPDSFPDKSDTQAWFKVLTESYGPVLDRNVDLIRELPPGERKAAMQVLISEFEAFGMNRDEAPDGALSAMFKAYRRAMSALEGSQ